MGEKFYGMDQRDTVRSAALTTPAPKDAPVEPDFAAMVRDAWKCNADVTLDKSHLECMRIAFAAGRQAAPQPEGAHDWALRQPGVDGTLAESIRHNKKFGKMTLPQICGTLEAAQEHNAALEAALRGEAMYVSEDDGAWVCMLCKACGSEGTPEYHAPSCLLHALTTAGEGKGKE